jgi:hypothetical protein
MGRAIRTVCSVLALGLGDSFRRGVRGSNGSGDDGGREGEEGECQFHG